MKDSHGTFSFYIPVKDGSFKVYPYNVEYITALYEQQNPDWRQYCGAV